MLCKTMWYHWVLESMNTHLIQWQFVMLFGLLGATSESVIAERKCSASHNARTRGLLNMKMLYSVSRLSNLCLYVRCCQKLVSSAVSIKDAAQSLALYVKRGSRIGTPASCTTGSKYIIFRHIASLTHAVPHLPTM